MLECVTVGIEVTTETTEVAVLHVLQRGTVVPQMSTAELTTTTAQATIVNSEDTAVRTVTGILIVAVTLEAAEATLKAAEATLKAAEVTLETTEVRAAVASGACQEVLLTEATEVALVAAVPAVEEGN